MGNTTKTLNLGLHGRVKLWQRILPSAASPTILTTQLNDVARTIPLFVVFQVCAASAIISLLEKDLLHYQIIMWLGTVLLCSIILIWAFNKPNKHLKFFKRLSSILGIAPALVWSTLPLLFVQYLTRDEQLLGLGICITVQIVGIISLLRLPSASVSFSAIMSCSINYSLSNMLGTSHLVGTIIGTIFGATLILGILIQHKYYLEQLESESKLKDQADVIKLLLNDFERDTSDWLWETDANSALTYHSPRLATILNQTSEELRGRDLLSVIVPIPARPDQPSLSTLMAQHQIIVEQIYSVEIRDQSQYWQITARPIFDSAGSFTGYRGVGRDVSQQWNHDQEIRRAKDAAESANGR